MKAIIINGIRYITQRRKAYSAIAYCVGKYFQRRMKIKGRIKGEIMLKIEYRGNGT